MIEPEAAMIQSRPLRPPNCGGVAIGRGQKRRRVPGTDRMNQQANAGGELDSKDAVVEDPYNSANRAVDKAPVLVQIPREAYS